MQSTGWSIGASHRVHRLLDTRSMEGNRKMIRRLGGILGLVIAISLALALIWRVYIHHKRADHRDDPAVVALPIPMNVA